jgi:hypothetical protein
VWLYAAAGELHGFVLTTNRDGKILFNAWHPLSNYILIQIKHLGTASVF